MPTLFIPPHVRRLVDGQTRLEVAGKTVGEMLIAIEKLYPGVQELLCEKGELRPALAVAIDESMSNRGVHQKVNEKSEVHILPAIGGG